MRTLKNFVQSRLRTVDVYPYYWLWRRRAGSALEASGWLKSFRMGQPVDADGEPTPWLTYGAIHFLQRRPLGDLTVFEWGSGNSTIWWAKKAQHIVACEHDFEWYSKVQKNLPPNAEIHHIPLNDKKERYSHFLSAINKTFDVVVIDGRQRNACARNCLEGLTERGVIIFDNTHRAKYLDGIRFLEDAGFRRLEFLGMAGLAAIKTETTIFYRTGNCLEI